MGFKSGYTYIVKTEIGYWYVVQQRAQKSWVATNFTELDLPYENRIVMGNGLKLYSVLKIREEYKYRVSQARAIFRSKMFNVLKYGRIEE